MSNSFFSQKKYAEEDLQMLIKNQIEESINLDYKSARAIDNSPLSLASGYVQVDAASCRN
jgi:phage gp46-like protein